MMQSRGRRWSAVLACSSPSEAEDTVEESPPYEEWPELRNRLGFYTLPTINAHYHPYPSFVDGNKPLNEQIEEQFVRICPDLKHYKTQLIPRILEYCQSHFGTELQGTLEETINHNYVDVIRAYSAIFWDLIKDNEEFDEKEFSKPGTKVMGLFTQFSEMHEFEHKLSLALNRPAVKEFKDTTATLFSLLLQQATTYTHGNFWSRFNELNDKLEDCLCAPLALEEVRATIRALDQLAPESQRRIIDKVYPEKRVDQEAKIFRELRSLTGGRWAIAWFLTLLVECQNPANPLNELEKLQNTLKSEKAYTWSDRRWWSWIDSRTELDLVKNMGDTYKLIESTTPSAFFVSSPKGIMILAPTVMYQKLFLESMRQQLANPELIRKLTCPFKGRRRSCCGYGHYLWGLWDDIPNEERRRLKPPSKVCLKNTIA